MPDRSEVEAVRLPITNRLKSQRCFVRCSVYLSDVTKAAALPQNSGFTHRGVLL